MKAVCLSVLVAMLGVVGNANAVIRSPYPSRPSPPYQGRYIFLGHDSLTVAPKTVKPLPSRQLQRITDGNLEVAASSQ